MRIVTLNIQHGGGRRVPKLVTFLRTHTPDVVVLTEFRENDNARTLRADLASQGLVHFAAASTSAKENTVGIFAKRPFVPSTFPSLPVSDRQENNRHRFWGEIPELEGRYLRVVTLEDKVTIHNAFPDRRFKP